MSQGERATSGAPPDRSRHTVAPRHPHRADLSYSPRTRDCHLDVTTLRRFTPMGCVVVVWGGGFRLVFFGVLYFLYHSNVCSFRRETLFKALRPYTSGARRLIRGSSYTLVALKSREVGQTVAIRDHRSQTTSKLDLQWTCHTVLSFLAPIPTATLQPRRAQPRKSLR
jgi:hypothetical protein